MDNTNIELNAARYLRLIERCLPKVFRGPSRRRRRRATELVSEIALLNRMRRRKE